MERQESAGLLGREDGAAEAAPATASSSTVRAFAVGALLVVSCAAAYRYAGAATATAPAPELRSAAVSAPVADADAEVVATVAVDAVGTPYSEKSFESVLANYGIDYDREVARPSASAITQNAAPHVVLFLIDDQGFNDMGAGSSDLSWATPRLEALADGGVRLTRYYSMHLCTPARAALLTGRYPANTGMQHSMLSGNEPWGLPLNETVWPEYAQSTGGYEPVMVGKWHLGHYNDAYLPTSRGFTSFFGYYSGFEDHFDHVSEVSFCAMDGAGCWFDLKNGTTPVTNRTGQYGLYVLRDVATEAIRSRDNTRPLLLYFASPTVHMPVQTPPLPDGGWYEEKLAAVPNAERRAFAAATVATDLVAGDVVDALRETGHWDSTIFVCASDNGAQPQVSGAGSNWPLRGMKGYYFEGGVRTHAFVHSKLLGMTDASGERKYSGLFHVTDWLPTLVYGAAGKGVPAGVFDGVDHWAQLRDCAVRGNCASASPRTELLVNADDYSCYPNATAAECEAGASEYPTGAYVNGSLKLLVNAVWMPRWPVPGEVGAAPDTAYSDWSSGVERDMLFNVVADVTESADLKAELPEVYAAMRERFDALNAAAATPAYCGASDNAAATSVMDETHFLGPWTDKDSVSCADVGDDLDAPDGASGADDDGADAALLDDAVLRGDPANDLDDVALANATSRLAKIAATHNLTKLARTKANSFPTAVYCRYGLLPPGACTSGAKATKTAR